MLIEKAMNFEKVNFSGTIKKSPWHHKFSPMAAKTCYNGTILNKKGLNNE